MRPILLVLLSFLCAVPARADESIVTAAVVGSFRDVADNLTLAIEGRGLVINNIAHVGEMLARTGADLGNSKRVYDQAEVFEFCSATVSRAMMEADPRHVAFCPYGIAVYTLPDQVGKVFLAYRRLPPGPGLNAVDVLMRGIVADTQR